MSTSDDIAAVRVAPHEQAVFRELAGDEGAVLLQVGSGGYHGLNPMGSLIWGLLQDGPTVAELVEAVRARVSDPPGHLADEVVAFVVDLEERDLVVMTPPAP